MHPVWLSSEDKGRLHYRPQVLILDEATSALDSQTEHAVMDTIYQLQGTLTMITIAHRLSTLERCDRIVRLDGGRIVAPVPEVAIGQ